jgi:RNA polymerase sporulation-specific sigma factor
MFRISDDKASRNRLYEKILKRYYALILGEISKVKIIGYEFEDLKQEAFLVVFQVIKKDYRFKSRSPFWYFLRLCIRRKLYSLINTSRTKRNQAFTSARRFEELVYNKSEALEYTNSSTLPTVESPENKVIEKMMLALMVKELKTNLSDLEYKAYFEKSLNNLTYKQIMEKYGFNSKSIDNAMSRVGKKLARLRSLAS